MKWLARNWLKVVIVMGIISASLILNGILDVYLDNKQFEKDIEILDMDIAQKERKLEVKDEIIAGLEDKVKKKEAVIAEKDKARAEGEKENARITRDRDKWREKVKALPASVVVIETRIILDTDEIWERPDGILFSLTAAKDCLAILGDFSLVEKDRDKWRDNYNIAKGEIADLKEVVVDVKRISFEKDGQIIDLRGINKDWESKFDLSEKRNVQSYWKGAKQGDLVLGILGFIGGLVLGK